MRAGLFPGQGIPAKVVLEGLAGEDDLLGSADRILGYDLRRRVEIAARRKGATLPTLVAQPAIFVAGVMSWRRAEAEKRTYGCFAGHSLGEYTALVAGRALTFEDALAAVKVRAEAMEAAGKLASGGMAAVLGLDVDAVTAIAAEAGAAVANDNAPGQIVIAGPEDGLARAGALVRSAGARSVLLQVSGPFHTQAMAPAAPRLAEALSGIDVRKPVVPVISNVTATPYSGAAEIRELLVKQLTHPVRFRESLVWLWSESVREFDDFGPGDVCSGLAQRTFRSLENSEVPVHA